jgi:F-type H+-transporting ATPase subunit alpha
MRQVAGTMRLELAQYREMAAFAQFGSDLDKATQAQLAKGERLVEILKQDQYQPLPVEKQIAIIYAANNKYLDNVPVSLCRKFEAELYRYLDDRHPGVLSAIREKKVLDPEVEEKLRRALDEFKEVFQREVQTTAA